MTLAIQPFAVASPVIKYFFNYYISNDGSRQVQNECRQKKMQREHDSIGNFHIVQNSAKKEKNGYSACA